MPNPPHCFFFFFFLNGHPQLSSVLTVAIRPDLLGSSIHLTLVVWKPLCLIIVLGRVNQNNWGILSIRIKSPCWALCCCSWISTAWRAFSTLIQAPEIATERQRTCINIYLPSPKWQRLTFILQSSIQLLHQWAVHMQFAMDFLQIILIFLHPHHSRLYK